MNLSADKDEPLVHVLVINWNGLEHVEECFHSLLASPYRNVKFVLLDNASSDGSREYVQEHFGHDPRLDIVNTGDNLGWSRGNNVGLQRAIEAGAKYVFLLNNDTSTAPEAIDAMVAAAEADASIGSLAPKILLYENPHLLNSIGLDVSLTGSSWDRGLGRLDGVRWNEIREVVGVCGAAWFIRCEVLRITGLLPTDFGIYYDDLDLCIRIWNAGYRIVTCPEAVVRHKYSATMGQGKHARHKHYLLARNRLRMIQRNYPARCAPQIASAWGNGACRTVGRALLDGKLWEARTELRALASATRYLPEMLRERRRRRDAGLSSDAFWRFVRRDVAFFPGTEFPEKGWYAPRNIGGEMLRPISVAAEYSHDGGPLRVRVANPHPKLGNVIVKVTQGYEPIASFNVTTREDRIIEPPAGPLHFAAQSIFYAEDTGELVDICGWLRVEPAASPTAAA